MQKNSTTIAVIIILILIIAGIWIYYYNTSNAIMQEDQSILTPTPTSQVDENYANNSKDRNITETAMINTQSFYIDTNGRLLSGANTQYSFLPFNNSLSCLLGKKQKK